MILLDFIIYYLTLYFTNRPKTVSWTSPVERAIYALSLITTSWILAIQFFIIIHFGIDIESRALWIYVLIALGLMWLYKYIYITKSRLKLISSLPVRLKKNLKLNDIQCVVLSWLILLISFALPFVVLISNMK